MDDAALETSLARVIEDARINSVSDSRQLAKAVISYLQEAGQVRQGWLYDDDRPDWYVSRPDPDAIEEGLMQESDFLRVLVVIHG